MKRYNYTRRRFLKTAGMSTAAVALQSSSFINADSEKKPNIILILADDLGYECLGCYGSTSYKTPVLDELARTGIQFNHCYAQPLCTPTRIQMMTGKYNFRNYKVFGILDPKEKTFSHVMKKAGYATCIAGKWQLYSYDPPTMPEWRGKGTHPKDAGFDEYCLWHAEHTEEKESRYADPKILENGKYREDLKGKYGPDIFCDYIINFIERNKTKPFFVYYPMALTHGPFNPTPDSKDWKEGDRLKYDVKYYPDMVAYMDKVIGRLMRKLDEPGLRENTLILFTSDNGTDPRIQSRIGDHTIQGGKGLTTDAGTHVPLIVNWKGVIPAGRVCDDLIDSTDFLPTIAEVGGASLSEMGIIDGRSFLPQIRGENGNPREWILCHFDPRSNEAKQYTLKRFARDKRYKLYDDGKFFDISKDVLEEKPVKIGEGNEEVENVRKRLQAVLDSMK